MIKRDTQLLRSEAQLFGTKRTFARFFHKLAGSKLCAYFENQRFIVRADERLTAFAELKSAIRLYRRNSRNLRFNDFPFPSKNSIDTVPGGPARSTRAKLFQASLRELHLTRFPQGNPRANGSLAQLKLLP